jgi:hypothetical protein
MGRKLKTTVSSRDRVIMVMALYDRVEDAPGEFIEKRS